VEETLNLVVEYDGLPTVTTSNDVLLTCPDDEADLTAIGVGFGSLEYMWDNGAGAGSTVTVQPIGTTTYIVTVTDDCNATVTGEIEVIVEPYIDLEITGQSLQVTCPGDMVQFSPGVAGGRDPFVYTWSTGANSQSIEVNPSTTEEYTLSVLDFCQNTEEGTFEVTVPVYNLQLTSIEDSTICELGEIELYVSATGGALNSYTFNWTGQDITTNPANDSVYVSSTESIATPDDSLTFVYQVDVTDYCGNAQSRSIEVTIRDCELVIPNVFTPGVDGFNDYLVVANVDQYPNSTLRIYNRWGFCVFESENYQNDWNGGKMEAGVYYYLFFPSDSDIEPMTGYVHLMTQNN
jgi:gliding motility-associated-like protein